MYVTDHVVEEISESGQYVVVFWDDVEFTFSVIDATPIPSSYLNDQIYRSIPLRIPVRTRDGKMSTFLGTIFACGGE